MQGGSLKLKLFVVEIRHLIRGKDIWTTRELEIELLALEARVIEDEERRKLRTSFFVSIGVIAVQGIWKIIAWFLD